MDTPCSPSWLPRGGWWKKATEKKNLIQVYAFIYWWLTCILFTHSFIYLFTYIWHTMWVSGVHLRGVTSLYILLGSQMWLPSSHYVAITTSLPIWLWFHWGVLSSVPFDEFQQLFIPVKPLHLTRREPFSHCKWCPSVVCHLYIFGPRQSLI